MIVINGKITRENTYSNRDKLSGIKLSPTPASKSSSTSHGWTSSSSASTATTSRGCLVPENTTLASCCPSSTSTTSSSSHVLQHWSIFQHIRQNHEPDFGTSDVNMLQLGNSAISVGHSHTGHLTIHVVFSFI